MKAGSGGISSDMPFACLLEEASTREAPIKEAQLVLPSASLRSKQVENKQDDHPVSLQICV